MKEEMDIDALLSARQKAERVIEGMPDGAIKEKAFEIAFRHLLADYNYPGKGKRGSRRKASNSTGAASAGAPQTEARRRSSKRQGPQSLVSELVNEGFFAEQRCLADIQNELETKGHHVKQTDLSPAMGRLTRAKILRRERQKNDKARSMWFYKGIEQ